MTPNHSCANRPSSRIPRSLTRCSSKINIGPHTGTPYRRPPQAEDFIPASPLTFPMSAHAIMYAESADLIYWTVISGIDHPIASVSPATDPRSEHRRRPSTQFTGHRSCADLVQRAHLQSQRDGCHAEHDQPDLRQLRCGVFNRHRRLPHDRACKPFRCRSNVAVASPDPALHHIHL